MAALSHAIECIGFLNSFLEIVSAFSDTLSLIRSKHTHTHTKRNIYRFFCNETCSAHDAVEDVKILSVSVTKSEMLKAAYDAETHFLQQKLNTATTLLNDLIGNYVLKMSMAENDAGSGLGLNHLKLIHKRSGEDGLRNIFCAKKNYHVRPRITSDRKFLDNVIPKLCQFFFLNTNIIFYYNVHGMFFVQVL
jgi:hypothetical protein